jgi:intracellular septation protein
MDEPILERDPSDPRRREINPLLKLILELGPLMIFFFANTRGERLAELFPTLAALGGPIFVATGLFMAATAVALAASWLLTRSLPIMPLVSGVVVLVFGTLTLWLQDDVFIKMKPTIVNALFGAVLLGGLAFGRSLLGYVFDSAFKMDAEGWRKLTLRWGLFFLFLAVVNEVVWRTTTTDTWVAFKVWGIMPITLLFTLSQMPLIMRHSLDEGVGK